jgi:hypothetical protein
MTPRPPGPPRLDMASLAASCSLTIIPEYQRTGLLPSVGLCRISGVEPKRVARSAC